MRLSGISWGAVCATALLAAPSLTEAAQATLRRHTVVPITFETTIRVNDARNGDRVTARVEGDRDLPRGTQLIGRVSQVRRPANNQPGFVDLEFTEIITPDGQRTRFSAVPIPLNDRFVQTGRDGRMVARADDRKKQNTVLGGAVGGFIVGTLMKKQFEGLMVGTLAGILIAETDRSNDGNVVVNRGTRYGALVARDVTVRWDERQVDRWGNGRFDDRYDPRMDRRDDDWNRRDDDWNRRDPRWDDDRFGTRQIQIEYRNRALRFGQNEQPYRLGNTVMVPLASTARQLGLEVEEGRNRVIFVESRDSSLRLEQGSNEYRLDGRRGTMARPVTERNRVLYVPIEVLAEVRNEILLVDGNRVGRRTY
jgi:hypothetical protein